MGWNRARSQHNSPHAGQDTLKASRIPCGRQTCFWWQILAQNFNNSGRTLKGNFFVYLNKSIYLFPTTVYVHNCLLFSRGDKDIHLVGPWLAVFSLRASSPFGGYNWWRALIFLPQELQTQSDLSSARYILLAIQHFHTYSFARITSNEPACFESWNELSVPVWSPWGPNLTHRRQLTLIEGESDLLPLPVSFCGVSSAIADITRVLAKTASCFYICRENLE